ncbi:MAG TPA: exopolysaccharide biosynthesis protein [Tepidisphaeraceae bacterium]|nr:exopolysaccharide biosynthesis protein [Tepidisphaeraceae bacterium]
MTESSVSATPHVQREEQSLEETIQGVSQRLPPEGVTLHDIFELIGRDSLLLLCIFLTLIFLVPVSVPGVSTVFGAGILLIGVSRLFNRNLWLPARVQKRVISTEKLRAALGRALKWLRRLEKISRPHRLRWLAAGGPIGTFNNLSLILGAVLLMAPFGLIPFSNTLPALAILLLALGLLQRDGVCILLGHLANIGTILYFGFLIAGGGVAIKQAIERFF